MIFVPSGQGLWTPDSADAELIRTKSKTGYGDGVQIELYMENYSGSSGRIYVRGTNRIAGIWKTPSNSDYADFWNDSFAYPDMPFLKVSCTVSTVVGDSITYILDCGTNYSVPYNGEAQLLDLVMEGDGKSILVTYSISIYNSSTLLASYPNCTLTVAT